MGDITDDDVKEIKNAARKDAIRDAKAAIKEAKDTNSSYTPTDQEKEDIVTKFVSPTSVLQKL